MPIWNHEPTFHRETRSNRGFSDRGQFPPRHRQVDGRLLQFGSQIRALDWRGLRHFERRSSVESSSSLSNGLNIHLPEVGCVIPLRGAGPGAALERTSPRGSEGVARAALGLESLSKRSLRSAERCSRFMAPSGTRNRLPQIGKQNASLPALVCA
jgi:hypothetical protein